MGTVVGAGSPDWLRSVASGSDTGARLFDFPWESTSLGDPDTWSDTMRSAFEVCLCTSAPMLIAWGPELVRVFNPAYMDLAGEDNLAYTFGVATSVAWSDTWALVGPILLELQQGVRDTATIHRRFAASGERRVQDRWLELSCSRIGGHDGDSGVLLLGKDVTDRVVSERHLICLRDLATGLLETKDLADVCVRAARLLSVDTGSIPWAEFHLLEDNRLIRVAATRDKSLVAPSDHQMKVTLARGRPRVVHDRPAVVDIRAGQVAEGGSWTYMAPLGFDRFTGVFVAGLNPSHRSDPVYRAFIDLCWKAISVAIDSADHHSEELRTQLRISTTLQQAMLSPVTDSPTVAARYVPATGGLVVGGDWYDVIGLGNGLQALTVGDCVGHDLEAAAIMGQLRSASRALLVEGNGPAQVLHAMDLFADVIDGLAATMVCAILDKTNGLITYSSAGHPPGLLLRQGGSEWLDQATGTPLGVRLDERREATTTLADKDLVLFYSDGLVERRHEPLTCGLDRLQALSEAHWADPVQAFADAILGEMTSAGMPDDIVLVAARTHRD